VKPRGIWHWSPWWQGLIELHLFLHRETARHLAVVTVVARSVCTLAECSCELTWPCGEPDCRPYKFIAECVCSYRWMQAVYKAIWQKWFVTCVSYRVMRLSCLSVFCWYLMQFPNFSAILMWCFNACKVGRKHKSLS